MKSHSKGELFIDNISPCVVSSVDGTSDLIKVAARAPAMAPLKIRAIVNKASTHAHRFFEDLFEIVLRRTVH